MTIKQRTVTCLWFDTQGEAAATFYVSLFPNSRITTVSRYGKGSPLPEGTALVVNFELDGIAYMALNGGPVFQLSEAASIVAYCGDQSEIDRLWTALTADGGRESRCGWLRDRFGLSWQIVPARLAEMMSDPDPARKGRVFARLMSMGKIDLPGLEAAFTGEA